MSFSFYFCYGKNAGFRIEWKRRIKRIVLWKIAIGYMNRDIEVFGMALIDKLNHRE
jgi:hypothetical protein